MKLQTLFDEFIRSEFMQSWHADNDSQGYGSRMDRFARVQDAAESGAYGATHAEIIQDWRDAVDQYLESLRGKRTNGKWTVRPYRIDLCNLDRLRRALGVHIDACETWHEKNGSLHEEIG